MDEPINSLPEKKEKVIEVGCITCGFDELIKTGGDHTSGICPRCSSGLIVVGIYEGASINPLILNSLKQVVEHRIRVERIGIERGIVLFKVNEADYHSDYFPYFMSEFKRYGYIPAVRRYEEKGKIDIIVLPKGKEEDKKRDINVNIILFIATLITTTWAGYILAEGNLLDGFLFAASLLSIVGLHELGHMTAARKHGIDYSLPYFIPVPPFISPIGTFGAVISSRSPTKDRNALFDLGVSGPIAGFVVTIIVLIIGLMLSTIVPATDISGIKSPFPFTPPPVMLFLIGIISGPFNLLDILTGKYLLALHPITIAGWIGAIVTMLNLMPAGFLDGGHISRSLFDTRLQRIISYIIAFITFLLGFWIMALIMLLMAMGGHPGPLDDVSELSTGRKILSILVVIILALSISLPSI